MQIRIFGALEQIPSYDEVGEALAGAFKDGEDKDMVGSMVVAALLMQVGTAQEPYVKKETVALPVDAVKILSAGQILYLNSDGTCSAYDLPSIKLLWQQRVRGGYGRAQAKIYGDYMLVELQRRSGDDGPLRLLACLSLKDGSLRWTKPLLPYYFEITGSNSTVYARVSMQQWAAIDAKSGEELWRRHLSDRSAIISPGPVPDLVFTRGWLLRSFWDTIECFDAKTGSKLWEKDRCLVNEENPLTTAKGVLMMEPNRRTLELVAFKDGSQLWEMKRGHEPDLLHNAGANWLGLRKNKLLVVDPITGELGPERTLPGVPVETLWSNIYEGLASNYKAKSFSRRDDFEFDFRTKEIRPLPSEPEDSSILWSTEKTIIRLENGSLTRYERATTTKT